MPPKTSRKTASRQDRHIRKQGSGQILSASRKAAHAHTKKQADLKRSAKDEKTLRPEDAVRIVNLGGLDEIGRNMSYIEYKDDIVIIDMGFQFPEEDTPGIDYIIPNIDDLKPKKDKIRAVVITHGHYDHIGTIPYSMGVVVKTPLGNIAHFGDFHLDRSNDGKIYHVGEMERVGKMGIDVLMMDSTNALVQGTGISEYEVVENIEKLFLEANGRIIIATFSSMLTRIGEMIRIAEKLGKKVIINGRSMKQNVQIAETLGYFKFKSGTIISVQEMNKHKPEKVLIISTGAQGEPNAGLMRIVNGDHKFIQIQKGDTFIFSSSVVPGNERSVQTLTDNIARQGAKVYNSKLIDIHKSGHAPQEDIKIVLDKVKPKFLVPVHAYYHMRFVAGELGKQMGIPEKNIKIIDNGVEMLLTKDDLEITDREIDTSYVMIDGLGVGDVEEVVLRDRLMLSEEGMIVIIATLNRKTGKLMKNPDIISRGFIYMRDNQQLLKDIRVKIKSIVNRIPRHQQVESDYVKALFREQVGQFVFKKTHRRPMILPVIIEI